MREADLLQHIFAANAALPPNVTLAPGDDMGAIRVGDLNLLVTVDQVIDGLHFDLRRDALAAVARKAVTRNLSDVAAMAGTPIAAVAAGCLPRDFGRDRADALFDALRATAGAYHCPLIGGDLSIWDGRLVLSVTVLAHPDGIEPVTRRGACLGDSIYVTGQVGASLATGHHLTFEPRLAVARALAGSAATRPHCMIDLSDGLARDLGHLCDAAGLGAMLQADRLPLRGGDWIAGVGDGEDYELLFTADQPMPHQILGVPVTRIGCIVPRDEHAPLKIQLNDGSVRSLTGMGWEHHA